MGVIVEQEFRLFRALKKFCCYLADCIVMLKAYLPFISYLIGGIGLLSLMCGLSHDAYEAGQKGLELHFAGLQVTAKVVGEHQDYGGEDASGQPSNPFTVCRYEFKVKGVTYEGEDICHGNQNTVSVTYSARNPYVNAISNHVPSGLFSWLLRTFVLNNGLLIYPFLFLGIYACFKASRNHWRKAKVIENT